MTTTLLIGLLLVLAGLAGSVNACLADPNDRDLLVGGLAGLAMAVGFVCLAVGAASRGYHRRPLGAPPGDMDPSKADLPPPPTVDRPVNERR